MPDDTPRPRSGTSATALLLTVFGELVLPRSGEVWTSTIVDGLGALGVTERNARQAVARLADDDLVERERVGRLARWRLTAAGRRLLADGAERIYRFGAGARPWDRRWLVVHAPVHEDERAKRVRLRNRLGFAGFGFLGSTIAVSPHLDREQLANDMLAELGLDGEAIVLIAETGTLVPDEQIIDRAWDLDGLERSYRDFLGDIEPRRPADDAARFVALVELVHAWRRFPFDDPEIPDELLPGDWPGRLAKRLFDERRAAWSDGAGRWFELAERRGDPASAIPSTTS